MVNILSKKAVLAHLAMSSWGVRKFDKDAAEEVLTKHAAEKQTGLFTKRLLNKKAMKEIRSIRSAARTYHKEHTLPWNNDGVRILPTEIYLEYKAEMDKFKNEFTKAVASFIKEYPTYQAQAKKELGSLYNENDYPSAANVRARFGMEVIIDPVPATGDFRAELDPVLIAEVNKDLDTRLNSVLQDALKDAAQRVAETVGHMVERLKAYKPSDKSKGKKVEGKFHDSLVEHVRDLAKLLPAFNLNKDPKLDALQKRIMKELCPHDPEALRDDDALRKKVVKEAEAILKHVSEFIS